MTIPYDNIGELPEGVKGALPRGGQRLWMEAYNYAYSATTKKKDRTVKRFPTESDRAKYAWGVVKKVYRKPANGEKWVKKNSHGGTIAEVASDLIIMSEEIMHGIEDRRKFSV